MKFLKVLLVMISIASLTSCASGYKSIEPAKLNYNSVDTENGITMKYRYNLLDKKYAKKEEKKDIRLVAVEITNNSGRDITFGEDVQIAYASGNDVYILTKEETFKSVKQSPATYLFYLLLSPINLYTTSSSNGVTEETSSTPIGLVLGPGIAGGNMIAAGSANKKFKKDLMTYDLSGTVIENGKTMYGLVGIKSGSFDALALKLK